MMPGVNYVIYMVSLQETMREQLQEYHYTGASH